MHGVIVVRGVSAIEANNIEHARQVALNVFEAGKVTELVLNYSWSCLFNARLSLPKSAFRYVSDIAEVNTNSFHSVLNMKFRSTEQPLSLAELVTKPNQANVILIAPSLANEDSILWNSNTTFVLASRGACQSLRLPLEDLGQPSRPSDIDYFPSLYSDMLGRGEGGCPANNYSFIVAMACAKTL